LSAPTKATTQGAVKNCRGHLKALMALYSVELLLVARSIVDEGFVKPSATFDSRVSSNQVIFLIL